MKYWWDSRDLRKDLKEIEKMYKKESDPKEKEALAYYIWHTKIIINEQEIKSCDNDSGKLYIDYLSRIVPLFELYYPYISRYENIISKVLPSDNVNVNESAKKLSKDMVIELVHELFKSTNSDIYNKFLKIYERKNKAVRFIKDDAIEGSTIFVPGVNKPYITLGENHPSYRSILLATTHEFAHGVMALINPNRYVSNDYFYLEIETSFFELIANDFFSEQLNDRKFYDDERIRMETECYIASDILEYKSLVDYRFRLGNPNIENFLEMVHDSYQKQMIISIPELSLDTDIKYLFSYIVAIELYEVYRKDKNLAFEMLNEIVAEKENKSEYANITSVVTPGKSLVKFRNRIIK